MLQRVKVNRKGKGLMGLILKFELTFHQVGSIYPNHPAITSPPLLVSLSQVVT